MTPGSSPTDFHAGDFIASQWTTQLDLTKDIDLGLFKPVTLAGGIEYRRETFELKPGDPASRYKEGSQSYPGFALTDAGSHSRNDTAVYADVANGSPSPQEQVAYPTFADGHDAALIGEAVARSAHSQSWATVDR